MHIYETAATVEDQGQVCVVGVPFAPGTAVDVTISPRRTSNEEVTSSDALTAARERMRAVPHRQGLSQFTSDTA